MQLLLFGLDKPKASLFRARGEQRSLGGGLVRSHGLPEVAPDLLFAFTGLVELLDDLQQLIGIFCSQGGVAQLSQFLRSLSAIVNFLRTLGFCWEDRGGHPRWSHQPRRRRPSFTSPLLLLYVKSHSTTELWRSSQCLLLLREKPRVVSDLQCSAVP